MITVSCVAIQEFTTKMKYEVNAKLPQIAIATYYKLILKYSMHGKLFPALYIAAIYVANCDS